MFRQQPRLAGEAESRLTPQRKQSESYREVYVELLANQRGGRLRLLCYGSLTRVCSLLLVVFKPRLANEGDTTIMKCPRDGTQLQVVRAAGVELDKCHKCDGLWLDAGELKALRSKRASGLEEEMERRYGNPKFETNEVSGYMRCPRCGEEGRLSRHHVSYFHAPVQVDRCQNCFGIWLDDRELDLLLDDKKVMDKQLNENRFVAACKSLAGLFQ